MTNSGATDGVYDHSTVGLARAGVVGTLLVTALLCADGLVYIAVPAYRGWGGALLLVIILIAISANLALRRTWRRVESRQTEPTRRERMNRAAEVAGMSARSVAVLERSLNALLIAIVVVIVVISVRGPA